MHTKACIFDLDGVIVDTAKYHFLAWRRLAEELGIEFTIEDNERLKGVSRMASLEIILSIGNRKMSPDQKEELAALKNSWYVEYIGKMTPDEILPGVHSFLEQVKGLGIKTALGSASRNTPLILERVGLNGYFDAVADGNNVSKAKPDPEVFLTAARMLKTDPVCCIVFEDAVAGVEAALRAGMTCVGIGESKILNKAHHVVKGLVEMNIEVLSGLEKKLGYE